MSEKVLRIFELCKELASLFGDKQAVADIKKLYAKHSKDNMFKDMEEVANMINEVAKKPEVITKAKTPNAILAAKKLDSKKMGDIVIVKKENLNEIIHANKKRLKEFDRLMDSLVETPAPSTHRQKPTGELTTHNNELSGANARSAKPRNRIYSVELSPSLESLCVQETKTTELAQHHTTAHIEVSHIANSDDETIPQKQNQSQSKPKLRRHK